jgi:DNA helicase HerA-like ATPase
VFAEELLQLLSQQMSEEARVCLVLEEAHSLVPEWNSTTYDGDQRASNGTAKAVLQGRKYGLGVIIITQRTANVTKTILNQCNTVFALRIYDATGMEFLRNYIGDAYADVLSGLADRTAVVFGRASSCPSPVIIRVNDHQAMIEEFWNPIKERIPVPIATTDTDSGGDRS